jgi:hypothetical protein
MWGGHDSEAAAQEDAYTYTATKSGLRTNEERQWPVDLLPMGEDRTAFGVEAAQNIMAIAAPAPMLTDAPGIVMGLVRMPRPWWPGLTTPSHELFGMEPTPVLTLMPRARPCGIGTCAPSA